MLPDPVGEVVVRKTRLPLRAPEFRCPGEDAEVVVHPVVCPALDRLLGVVLEVVEDGHRRISGELRATVAEDLVRTEVLGR
jgi:hypothetical protein